jgi:hypothetical protein
MAVSTTAEPTVDMPWHFDEDESDITFMGSPVFRVYREEDFPCVEEEDRAAADLDLLDKARLAVRLLNGRFPCSHEAWAAFHRAYKAHENEQEGWLAGMEAAYKAENLSLLEAKP